MVYTIVLQRVQVSSLQSHAVIEGERYCFHMKFKKTSNCDSDSLRLNIYMAATSFVFFMLYG